MQPSNAIVSDLSSIKKTKYVLLVPDSLFWVTGRIAKAIEESLANTQFEPLICSGVVLKQVLSMDKNFPKKIHCVHFLTPHIATKLKKNFYDSSSFISTIHHIENDASTEPESYSDAIMTVSYQWHNELMRRGVPESKLVMIQNGIDTDLFKPVDKERKTVLRKKYGLPLNSYIIGFSAKRDSDSCSRKGVDVLDKLIRSTTIEKSGFVWFIRGPGWNDFVDKLKGCGAKIYYCPFLESDLELAESYQVLDSFVITSRIEGGPVPLLEAMATGLPVVTTEVGVALEIVNDQSNGFRVNFNSPEQINSRLIILKNDNILAKSIGDRARKTITDNYKWCHTTKNVSKIYDIAEANFTHRKKSIYSNRKIVSLEKLKKFILAKEYIYFANYLRRNGAYKASLKIYIKVITNFPLVAFMSHVKTFFGKGNYS